MKDISIIFLLVFALNNLNAQVRPKSLEEQLLHTTCQIITIDFEAKDTFNGTGFFLELKHDGESRNFIVTNRHVVKNQDIGYLIFNKLGPDSSLYGNRQILPIKKFEQQWVTPPDTAIDLAFLSLDKVKEFYKKKGIDIYTLSIPETLIPNDSLWNSLTILESVVMIGYPVGLIDTFNNTPIARIGVTATPPKLDYLGTKEFLIDIAAFPGSSGSPIFLQKTTSGFKKNPKALEIGIQNDYYFMGVLYSGPTYTPSTKQMKFSQIENAFELKDIQFEIPVNLGRVIKSTVILELKDLLFK